MLPPGDFNFKKPLTNPISVEINHVLCAYRTHLIPSFPLSTPYLLFLLPFVSLFFLIFLLGTEYKALSMVGTHTITGL